MSDIYVTLSTVVVLVVMSLNSDKGGYWCLKLSTERTIVPRRGVSDTLSLRGPQFVHGRTGRCYWN
jgi:hypothetical protein